MADESVQLSSHMVNELHNVFLTFCCFGAGQRGADEMDGAKFAKFAKDCALLGRSGAGRPLTRTDVDLIFTKIKGKGNRKIDFNTFLEGCYQIAATKQMDFIQLVQIVLAKGNASTNNVTRSHKVSQHDDVSSYTGVYARGGPKATGDQITLESLADRSDYDYRGRKLDTDPHANGLVRNPDRNVRYSSAAVVNATMSPAEQRKQQGMGVLAQGQQPPQYANSPSYPPPQQQMPQQSIFQMGQQQPPYSPYGQQQQQQQQYQPLPPQQYQQPPPQQYQQLPPQQYQQPPPQQYQQPPLQPQQYQAPPAPPLAGGNFGGMQGTDDEAEEYLHQMFAEFCSVSGGRANGLGKELEGSKFVKFCRDNQLLDPPGRLTTTDLDLIFAKAKAKGKRKLNYEEFRYSALPMVAQKKGMAMEALLQQLSATGGGPLFYGTKAENVRHHDDRSTYTGVYARGGPTNARDQITLETLADRTPYDVRGRKL